MTRRLRPHALLRAAALASLSASLSWLGCAVEAGGPTGTAACPGDVRVQDKPGLDAAGACGTITGDLHIELTALSDLSGLEGLRAVEGDLLIQGNAALVRLSGLSGLVSVGGDLVVRDNPRLPQAEAEDLASALEAMGGLGGEAVLSHTLATDGLGDDPLEDGDADDGEPVDEEPAEDGDLPEGDLDEGDLDEGDLDDGDLDEGDLDEGDLDDGEPVDEEPVDEEPVDEPQESCGGDPGCALDQLTASLATLLDLLESTLESTRLAIDLVRDGNDAEAVIEEARDLAAQAGEAFEDVLHDLFVAFLSGVDVELVWAAVDDAVAAAEGLHEALDELLDALEGGGVLGAADGCDGAADDLEDAEETLQVLSGGL